MRRRRSLQATFYKRSSTFPSTCLSACRQRVTLFTFIYLKLAGIWQAAALVEVTGHIRAYLSLSRTFMFYVWRAASSGIGAGAVNLVAPVVRGRGPRRTHSKGHAAPHLLEAI